MEILRGDIFFVRKAFCEGNEQDAGRPAVIVSNNIGNEHANIVEVVYLTSQEKKPLPTHVEIVCRVPSTALCEQISTVSKERLVEFVRACTDDEMKRIDKALMVSLGIDQPVSEPSAPEEVPTEENTNKNDLFKNAATFSIDYGAVIGERNTYKNMYEQLLEKVLSQKG